MPTGRDWKRLASHIVLARIDAGYPTREDFVRGIEQVTKHRVSYRTISNLETGKSVGAETIALAEQTVGWEPGSADTVRLGGEPTLIGSPSILGATPIEDDDGGDLRTALRVLRRAMGREEFLRWVDEASRPEPTTEGDRSA